MSTEAELMQKIKETGEELRALKSARKPPRPVETPDGNVEVPVPPTPTDEEKEAADFAVTVKLSELRQLKLEFEDLTGKPFEGGSIPASAKKAAPPADAEQDAEAPPEPPAPLSFDAAIEASLEAPPAPDALPPAPPSPRTEEAAAETTASTYAAKMTTTACALAGKDAHKTTMFDGNMIASFLLPGLAGADGSPEGLSIHSWMGTAKNVDLPDYTEKFVASVTPIVQATLEDEGNKGFLVGDAATLADVSVYLALSVAPGFDADTLPDSVKTWCSSVSAFIATTTAEAAKAKQEKEEKKKSKRKENRKPAASPKPKETTGATEILAAALSPNKAPAPLADSTSVSVN